MPYIFSSVPGEPGSLVFQFNGQFALKNYNVEIINGNRLKVTSAQNELFSLLEVDVTEVEINGIIYNDANSAQIALQSLVFSDEIPVVLTADDRAAIMSGYKGSVNKSTATPNKQGFYLCEESGVYPNINNLEALEHYVTFFIFNGTTWSSAKFKIPGGNVATKFDVGNSTDPQAGKQINSWLVNEVEGGESDEVKKFTEEVGEFYGNIGINLNGTTPDSLAAGTFNVKSNSTAVADANKYLTKANIRLAAAGNFKFCIGRFYDNKFNVRWESAEKTGVVGWNAYDFKNDKVKINSGEMAAVLLLTSSSASIYFGDPGASGNRFVQYSTTANGTQANLGSYYALWFELSTINEVALPSEAVFNLSKSVTRIVEEYSQKGYSGSEKQKGESVVSTESDATAGYAINKIELDTTYLLDKLEIKTITAGTYQIVIGFIEQAGKFIEKNVISKTLTAGLNVVSINPVILEVGDYVGLKFPSKYPVNNTPTTPNLWISDNYTGILTAVPGKSLPIKLFLKEYIKSPIAMKSEVASINSSIIGLQQIFMYNGKKVKLTFTAGGVVTWEYLEGFSNILHLGNSIAKHPLTSYWWGSWGMAASEKSKDYVNRFLAKMQVLKAAAVTTALNIAGWESAPSTWDKTQLDVYLSGKDLICIRLGENATYNGTYKNEFSSLISYIKTKNPAAKIIIGGVFWADSNKDTAMSQVAAENNLTFVKLSHLDIPANRSFMGAQVKGDDNQWHTVNNTGVAAHPGDLGMEAIASELFNALGL